MPICSIDPHRLPAPDVESPRRRTVLKAGAIAGVTAGSALLGACSTLSEVRSQVSGTSPINSYSRRIGDIEITTLLDGFFTLEPDMLENVDEEQLGIMLRSAHRAPYASIPLWISTHLLRLGDRIVLVGAGAGQQMGASAGNLQATLASLAVEPEDIDDLLLTHMHPDHVGGAIFDGKSAFPNATLHLSETDAAYWSDPDNVASAPKPLESFFPFAAKVIAAYGDRINRFSGEVDLGNGLTSHPLPGHTPGHTGYRVSDGNEQLLIWGDMAIIAAIQFGHPTVGVVFDSDVSAAIATRRRTFELLSSDQMLATGTHLPFPAYGHVVADGDVSMGSGGMALRLMAAGRNGFTTSPGSTQVPAPNVFAQKISPLPDSLLASDVPMIR